MIWRVKLALIALFLPKKWIAQGFREAAAELTGAPSSGGKYIPNGGPLGSGVFPFVEVSPEELRARYPYGPVKPTRQK